MLLELPNELIGLILEKIDIPSLFSLEFVCKKLVNHNRLNELKKYKNKDNKLNTKALSIIAKYRYLNILKWARENDCTWNEDTCYYAALNGH